MPTDTDVEARLADYTVPHQIAHLAALLSWCEMALRPPVDVVLDAEVVAISRPVSELSGGVELGALIASVDRSVERRVRHEMPASGAIANDGKQFKANDRRFAYGLVVADFSAQAPVGTFVIFVRCDILQLTTNPVTVPATRHSRHRQLYAQLRSLRQSERAFDQALRDFGWREIATGRWFGKV